MATKVLILVNVGVFLLDAGSSGVRFGRASGLNDLALFGPAVEQGDWYRLISSGFLHYGLLHIAFNMLLLYQLGSMIEPAIGRVHFFALYVAALLSGSFGALLISPLSATAGASGAVFGLLVAAAVGMRQRSINLWETGIGGLLVVNLIFTFAIPGISIGGHLGGLAGGSLVGGVMLRPVRSRYAFAEGLVAAVLVSAIAVAGAQWAAAT